MKTKITSSKSLQRTAATMVLTIICIIFLHVSIAKSQTVFWTEKFDNSCITGCLASSYTGPNGLWSIINIGYQGAYANAWFVSCKERGHLVGACGTGCSNAADATLHISNVAGSPNSLLCPNGDCGAAYDAGLLTDEVITNSRAVSPIINCAGKYTITMTFKYIANGDPGNDYCTIDYYDGTTWTTLQTIAVATTCFSGQGKWAQYPTVALPASANNNANVKIGFDWINNDDGAGTDPSVAVDSMMLSYQTVTGGTNCLAAVNHALDISPNPAASELNISFIQQENSSLKITIMDTKGQVVYTDLYAQFTGNYNKKINITDFAKGIYFVRTMTDKEIFTKKVALK